MSAPRPEVSTPAADPVQALVDAKAEEFLRASVRFVKTWQLSDDPMAGIIAISDAIDLMKTAHKNLEHQVKRSDRYFWRGSRNVADQASAIWNQLTCDRARCACQQHKLTHCPAHRDESPSFSVTVKDGRLLLHCFSGCSQSAVLSALQRMGLWTQPLGGVA